MEWFYFTLILAFLFWCAQMLMGHKRQSDRIDVHIADTVSNEEDVLEQAEGYEAQAAEKEEEMSGLQEENQKLEQQQKDIESKVNELKRKEASRRPTRHRVEPSGDS